MLLPAASNDPASMVAQAMSIYSNVSKGSSFPGGCAPSRSPACPHPPPPPSLSTTTITTAATHRECSVF